MKMLFSRWNSAPPSSDGLPLFQPFSRESHATTIHRRPRRSPRYSLFTLSKIKNLASGSKAQSKNCFTRSYGATLAAPGGASGCLRNRDSRTVQERTPALAPLAAQRAPLPGRQQRAKARCVGGGGERNRTDDLLLAKQALSQLSYTPQVCRRPLPPEDPGRRQRLRSNRESRAAPD